MEGEEGNTVNEEQLETWRQKQDELKMQLIDANTEPWQESATFDGLKLIAGVDISFVNGTTRACVALVTCSYPSLEVTEIVTDIIDMTVPYASGFLAFREVAFFQECLEKLKDGKPQIIMVDGNGILHQRGFGVACHLGVLTDIPCIGIAKKLMQIDGLEKDEHFQKKKTKHLKDNGDSFNLVGDSQKVWGKALKSTADSCNPVFVSVGHKICLDTATKLVHKCCKYRIPEPVRQADILSKKKLRDS
ncbi:endonuclease V-like [Apostichopus japonicus]|uniref:endonuclease V-like n=1 Tax=Stichopus japonicus TaxID=307972 RepID=UPI003AB1AE92